MRIARTSCICVSLAALASFAWAAEGDVFRWRSHLARGRVIEIKGVNGDVRAGAASGDQVEVIATKHARRSDPQEVEIRVVEHDEGATICAVYPSDNPRRPNECKPGSEGRMNVHDNDVKVDFEIRVPSGVRFVGRTVNGSVEAASLGSDAEAYTVNGKIRISTAGFAQARTVNGSIFASLGNAGWTKPLSFHTVNGGITLELPANISTDVSAKTVNGRISTDFPLTVRGKFIGRSIDGAIGSGGRELNLRTVNGSIELRKGI